MIILTVHIIKNLETQMGNTSSSRSMTNSGMFVGSLALAPFTGGFSLLGLIPATVRTIAEVKINWRIVDINNCISSSYYDYKIKNIEIRYCHIDDDWIDAGVTLAARTFVVSTDAAHHWFVILELEGFDDYIYIDKHYFRNILIRKNKKGKNGGGDAWFESALKWRSDIKKYDGNVTLGQLISYVESDEHKYYHLIDDNCQHFAKKVYSWLT
ncbi:hypothetical protein QJ850_gp090 [Acanthamoeba polyphaga mimivirus]|uniref:Uncharacterized protein n=1 Tax=Acanthamoeba polyphaga mimivirus Kroon TaxID=3069720 RepID=A0A0G2Y7T1_9VIRU|nr:hypothetical protein QJ850_gp090 [Acanthamoeba polyphaga mimivirus]AKI80609.1 hypothetical protein [Acanthamoeba polyphaga mimivirus Kroon]